MPPFLMGGLGRRLLTRPELLCIADWGMVERRGRGSDPIVRGYGRMGLPYLIDSKAYFLPLKSNSESSIRI